jgi:5'-nucleotidase
VINLNVPGRPLPEVMGLRAARLAPIGQVQVASTSISLDDLQTVFEASRGDAPADSDTALLAAGFATHTPLRGVAETSLEPTEALPEDIHIERKLQSVPQA